MPLQITDTNRQSAQGVLHQRLLRKFLPETVRRLREREACRVNGQTQTLPAAKMRKQLPLKPQPFHVPGHRHQLRGERLKKPNKIAH
jgi:23S rRNA-/tRNA-specific pseudouridylate synthase